MKKMVLLTLVVVLGLVSCATTQVVYELDEKVIQEFSVAAQEWEDRTRLFLAGGGYEKWAEKLPDEEIRKIARYKLDLYFDPRFGASPENQFPKAPNMIVRNSKGDIVHYRNEDEIGVIYKKHSDVLGASQQSLRNAADIINRRYFVKYGILPGTPPEIAAVQQFFLSDYHREQRGDTE